MACLQFQHVRNISAYIVEVNKACRHYLRNDSNVI